MRAAQPAAAAAAFVAAGRAPTDLANLARRPFVKICGVTDADGALAAIRAGADAIGLNVVPGTPRELSLAEAAALAGLIRSTSPSERPPLVVAVTADASLAQLTAIVGAIDPDVVQLSGSESLELAGAIGRRTWKVLHLPASEPANPSAAVAELVSRGRAYLAGGVERLLLDTAGGPHPGGTGIARRRAAGRRGRPRAPGDPGRRPRSGQRRAGGAIDSAGRRRRRVRGRAPPRSRASGRPRIRCASRSSSSVPGPPVTTGPTSPFGPTPDPPRPARRGRLGRWGMERDFGGRYVPETLMAALEQLEAAYAAVRQDPVFWAELRELLADFAGRPTALYRADRLAAAVRARAERLAGGGPGSSPAIPRLRLYLKREDLAHTGAHKINNALGQALLTRRLGKTRVIAETGAGQHGVATATACALLDLPCVVYMGAEDIERQGPNVLRMRALGAEVRSVTSGTATLKDAVNEAMRDWVTNVQTTHYVLGSAMGPHPYPTIVRDLQRRIGDEAAAQLLAVEGRLPDLAIACVGGGSNAIGLLARFIGEPTVRLAVVEAAGDGIETGRHAAAILGGTPGILHGSRSLMLQDADGQVTEAHSASAGLDYPGIGPQLAALAEGGRIEVAAATDREAVAAMRTTTRTEGILPALETAHAVAALPKLLAGVGGLGGSWPDDLLVLLGFSGRGDKDLAALERFADVEPWGRSREPVAPSAAATAPAAEAGHERDRRRPADRRRLRPGPRRRPRRPDPVRRRRLPRRRDQLRGRPGRGRRGCRPARGRPAVFGPAGRRRHPPAGVRRGARRRRDPRAIAPAHRADRGGPAGPAARPDGLREPGHRWRRRRGGGSAPGRSRRGRPDRGRPDARRGRPVRGGRPGGGARRRLPRRPDHLAGPPRR